MALHGDARPLERERERESPDGLRILVREQGTTTAIEMAGEWDLAAREAARDAITRALTGQPECVLLDLSQLEFIDSSGLHVTIELAQCSRAQNVRLLIIPGPPAIQRVFELTGLLQRLPFIDAQPSGSPAEPSRTAPQRTARSPAISPPPAGRRPRRPSPTALGRPGQR